MKNSLILIYLIFTVFISVNNFTSTEKYYPGKHNIINFTGNSYLIYYSLTLPSGKLSHKLNHNVNIKIAVGYLNDFTQINKQIKYLTSKTYDNKYLNLSNHGNFYNYNVNKFLPILTPNEKTVQTEFLLI